MLGTDKTTSPVDLDQLFDTLDPRARKGLQGLIKGSAAIYQGRGKQANSSAKYVNPALSTTSRLVNEINSDQGAFTDFVVDSSRVVTSLSQRQQDLTDLVTNANKTSSAIASESQSLDAGLRLLPGTLRKANTTLVNTRSTLDDLDVLVDASKPATKRLAPFLKQLRPLVAQARPTIADLRKTIRQPGDDNDLTELLRSAPGLEAQTRTTVPHAIDALRKSTPDLSFIRSYAPELGGFLRDFGQGAANYDANGHYVRVAPVFNAFKAQGSELMPRVDDDRLGGLTTGQTRRCPGGATQPAADGSSTYRDQDGALDCDPSQVVPGS